MGQAPGGTWDSRSTGNASAIEAYISYLRHKIDAVEPPLIQTVRGVGSTLALPPGAGLTGPTQVNSR